MNKNKLLKILTSTVIGSTLATVSVLPFVLNDNGNNTVNVLDSVINNNEDIVTLEGAKFTEWTISGNTMSSTAIDAQEIEQTLTLTIAITDYEITIKGINGNDPAYDFSLSFDTIPENYAIVRIETSAFQNVQKLTSIILPDSVKSIGPLAFSACGTLTSIELGNVESIASTAFSYCASLTSITIPDTVVSIGISAFGNCELLETVKLGKNIKNIGGAAFQYCPNLRTITIPNSVTSFGNSIFSQCINLSSINWWLDNSLESGEYTLGASSFSDTGNPETKIYTNDKGKLNSINNHPVSSIQLEAEVTNKADEIKVGTRSKIATIQLNNGQTDNLIYEVDASYSETSNTNKAFPSGAFEVINGELWYNGDELEGNVNVTVKVRDDANSTPVLTEPMSFLLYATPSPDTPTGFITNIKGGKASNIGEYNLSNPNETPVYSLVSATYADGSDASAAFEVNSSTGVLSYNGAKLTGNVTIEAKVNDDGVEYNFDPVTLIYSPADSNLAAIIGGTVGGVVGALAIAGGTAAYFSKKKKKLA